MRSARQAQACLWPFLGLAIIGCCVIAEYCVQGDGGIEAIVHSPDGHHRFNARGRQWYENARGERFNSYSQGLIIVLRFGEKEERYRHWYSEAVCRGIMAVTDFVPPSRTQPTTKGTGPTDQKGRYKLGRS
jgi:hypothetical protein